MALNRQRSMETDPTQLHPKIQRFLGNSDRHPRCKKACPLYPQKQTSAVHQAMSAFGPKANIGTLFDHLISAGDQRRRNRETERLGGLEIYCQLKVRRLLNGQIARFGSA